MAQQPSQETLIRLLFLLQKIPRGPHKTDVKRLTRYLEDAGYKVDVRTVQRDLKKLSEVPELPLECDENKPKGWSWSQEAKIWDMPAMNPQLALTFSLIDHYLKDKMPVTVMDFLNPYVNKAEEVLGHHQDSGFAKWLDKIRVIPAGIDQKIPAIDKYVLKTVYESLLEETKFKAIYQPRGEDETKEYVVNPLGLVFRNDMIYLVATLWGYTDIKHMVLHRFIEAEATPEKLNRPKNFNLDTYLKEGEFNYSSNPETIKLKLQMDAYTAQHLLECPLNDDQVVKEQKDGLLKITATVKNTEQLRMWLRAYGTNVEVLAPKDLREEMKKLFQTLLNRYS